MEFVSDEFTLGSAQCRELLIRSETVHLSRLCGREPSLTGCTFIDVMWVWEGAAGPAYRVKEHPLVIDRGVYHSSSWVFTFTLTRNSDVYLI